MTRSTAGDEFEREGLVRVRGVVGTDAVAAMRDVVWAALEERGVRRAERATWAAGELLVELAGALRPGPGSEALLWAIGRARVFAALPEALARAADEVFGRGVWEPVADQHGGLAAPNFPIAGRWRAPHAAWHVDEPTAAGRGEPWGLLGFVFLDAVAPGGGATVAVAGSPRRLGRLADARAAAGLLPSGLLTTPDALAALAAEPWFAALFEDGEGEARRRALDGGCVSDGVALRIVELTGEPGDVVFMDPRALHTVSANVSERARLTMRMVCSRVG